MLYFVARVDLVGCALEFLGRRGLRLWLGLGLVVGCMSPVDMICNCMYVRGSSSVDGVGGHGDGVLECLASQLGDA